MYAAALAGCAWEWGWSVTLVSRRARVLVFGLALMLLAVATSSVGEAGTFYPAGRSGYDVSFPQCGKPLPRGGSFGVVGVTNGLPWSANPCLQAEYQWARGMSSAPSLYMNTANPGPISTYWNRPGPGTCADATSYADAGCSYNYGWNAAADAFAIASGATSGASAANYWWLDVETANSWNGTPAANAAALDGYMATCRAMAWLAWGCIRRGASGRRSRVATRCLRRRTGLPGHRACGRLPDVRDGLYGRAGVAGAVPLEGVRRGLRLPVTAQAVRWRWEGSAGAAARREDRGLHPRLFFF